MIDARDDTVTPVDGKVICTSDPAIAIGAAFQPDFLRRVPCCHGLPEVERTDRGPVVIFRTIVLLEVFIVGDRDQFGEIQVPI